MWNLNYSSISEISGVLEKHGLAMTKKFGQNFLMSQQARERIVSLLDVKAGDEVWEIGPGLGAVTELILKSGAELSCCKMLDKGPEESMVISNFPFSGYTLLTDRAVIIKELFLELLLNTKRCNGYLMTCLYRRDILDRFNIRFNTGITMQEDEIFLLNYLLRVNCIVGIDMILYNYLRFETSACFNYYRRESDYFRERNWYALSLAQRDVFRNSGLDGTYSWIGSLLTFKVYFHEVQMVCSSPELRYFERLKKLRKISGRARGEKLNLKGGHRLFWQVLIYMPGLLPLLCFLKRRKDQCSRKVEHWLKGVFR